MEGLYDYLGKKYRKEDKTEKSTKEIVDLSNIIKNLNEIGRTIQKERSDITKRKMMKKQYWDEALNEISENNMMNASLAYLNAVPPLADKELIKHAAIGLILGSLSIVKEKDVEISKLRKLLFGTPSSEKSKRLLKKDDDNENDNENK